MFQEFRNSTNSGFYYAYLSFVFCIPQPVTPSGFSIGQHLEALDKKNNMMCVVSIKDAMNNRFLIHFDGWDDIYDYWVDPSTPYIHPVGWCKKHGEVLTPPNGTSGVSILFNFHFDAYPYVFSRSCLMTQYPDYKSERFNWDEYLKECNSSPAPATAFKPRQPIDFAIGHKVEVVDIRNPSLIRAATIKLKRRHAVLIHFDGWSSLYDFWLEDDSPNIYPVNWCSKTGHPLQPPPGQLNILSSFAYSLAKYFFML